MMDSQSFELSYQELNWIVQGLQHDLCEYYTDRDNAVNNSQFALANQAIRNRESLITKLTDMQQSKPKTIVLIH